MGLVSTLLLGALGTVVAAAPAAPLPVRVQKPRRPDHASEKPEQRKRPPAVGHVVLRLPSVRGEETNRAAGEPERTPEEALRLLGRRLPVRIHAPAPCPKATGDDLRAGLLALPPPRA